MSSKSSHAIKNRKQAKDVFLTPLPLAKMHIDMIPEQYIDCLWIDPCAGENAYYNQFPTKKKERYELSEGTSFFGLSSCMPIVICSNPPYSILDDWFRQTIKLNPKCFSYLIGIGNLTARRIEWCEKAGYGLTKMKMLKVRNWYGMCVIVVFEKDKKSIMSIDRTVWG